MSYRQKSAKRVGKISKHYDSPDEPQTLVQDILADLRHYCDEQDLDWDECHARAHGYYLDEIEADLAGTASVETESTVVFSTANITQKDKTLLDAYAQEHVEDPDGSSHFIFPTGYGYMVWVNPDRDFSEYVDGGLSEEFVALLRIAHQHGASFIRLDREAPHYGLPTFDW